VRFERTVSVAVPVRQAFDYLSDFTTTTEWDPGTVSTVRLDGEGDVGTTYRNISRFLGRETSLTYVVEERVPNKLIRLRGENETVVSVDTMTFRSTGSGTDVTYNADFTFRGVSRFVSPLLRPALARLANRAESQIRQRLNTL
jgi:carbon monoxide dehydrogenase subunit G